MNAKSPGLKTYGNASQLRLVFGPAAATGLSADKRSFSNIRLFYFEPVSQNEASPTH